MRGKIRIRGAWGPLSHVYIAGGPWTQKPKGYFGICMAPEVLGGDFTPYKGANTRPSAPPMPDITVDVEDFSTPDPDAIRLAALMGLQHALLGIKSVYVGCGFGIGRTGTLLGLMARIATPWIQSPVEFVRRTYYAQAIETQAQRDMVETLDVSEASATYQRWIWRRRRLCRTGYVIRESDWTGLPKG